MKTLDLREFYLPSGIYSIGYCSNIEKIILPQGASRISYCTNLKEIVLPQNSLLNLTETNHNISLTKFVVEYGHKYYCCLLYTSNYYNRFQTNFQCFLQHETSLGHRTFKCVDQQNTTIGHIQYAFNFTRSEEHTSELQSQR